MPRSVNRAPVELPLPLLAQVKEAAQEDGLTTAAATVIAVREWLERRGRQRMSTKTRFVAPQQAGLVAQELKEHGYTVTKDECTGYAINIAKHVDMRDEVRVLRIIDQALDGYYTDAEGYPANV